MTPTLTTSPITPAGSGTYSFGRSPYNSYNIDITLSGQSNYNSGPQYLQPTSRDPSISYNSPLGHDPMDDFFAAPPSAPQDMQANNFGTFSSTDTLPDSDFALFGSAANHGAYPAPPTGDMFPDMDCAYDDDVPDLDQYININ